MKRSTPRILVLLGIGFATLATIILFPGQFLRYWVSGGKLGYIQQIWWLNEDSLGCLLWISSVILLVIAILWTCIKRCGWKSLFLGFIGLVIAGIIPSLIFLDGHYGIVGTIQTNSISPDGRFRAYIVQNHFGFDTTNEFLFVQKANKPLKHNPRNRLIARLCWYCTYPEVTELRWSPDGKYIAVRIGTYNRSDFYVFNFPSGVQSGIKKPLWW